MPLDLLAWLVKTFVSSLEEVTFVPSHIAAKWDGHGKGPENVGIITKSLWQEILLILIKATELFQPNFLVKKKVDAILE